MSQPSTPRFQKEGPASPCTLHGVNLSWKNCTVLSGAMGIDKSTLGRTVISGCQARDETGDYSGGTTLEQMQAVATAHGVKTELHVGANVASLFYLAYQAALGRGFILQGNTQPDGRGNVNHAVWVNHAIGGTPGDPIAFRVYDPWSSGPADWSYAKTKAFMLALHPWGESDPRTLKSMGVNGGYALVFPDTEPHFHSHFGGVQASPFPDRVRARYEGVLVHSSPHTKSSGNVVARLHKGQLYMGFQYAIGDLYKGSRKWVGSHNGDWWVHEANLTHVGGTT